MKKLILCLLCLAAVCSLAGCRGETGAAAGRTESSGGVSAVLEEGMKREDPGKTGEETAPGEKAAPSEPEAGEEGQRDKDAAPEMKGEADTLGAEIDLTVLSPTMVYSQVFDMMMYPQDYRGKSVKMAGQCAVYYDGATDSTYYACIVQDATACCSQGIEFVLEEGTPYPKAGTEICVAGVYDTYAENGVTFCTLSGARLL